MDKQLKQLREAYKSLELLTERSYGVEFYKKHGIHSLGSVTYFFTSWVPYKVNKKLEYTLQYDLHLPYSGDSRTKLDISFDLDHKQFGLDYLALVDGVDARNVLDTVLEGLEQVLKMIYSDYEVEELMIKIEAWKEESESNDVNKRLVVYKKYIERSGISGWVVDEVDVDGDDIRIWISRERG